jgi:hypothetical protein
LKIALGLDKKKYLLSLFIIFLDENFLILTEKKCKGVNAGSRYQITLDGAEVMKRC